MRPVVTAEPPSDSPDSAPRPSIARAWDRFFFRPADPSPLALVRIAVGALCLWNFAVLGLDLQDWLGPQGWADPEAVAALAGSGAWSFWLGLPSGMLWPAYIGCLLILALFTIGLGSRVTAVLAWVVVVSTNRRAPVMLFGFDNIVATWTLYLAASGASGGAFSVDRLWSRRRSGAEGPPPPSIAANLGLRLIQLHLCLIYASAGLAKLQGVPWWDGSAVGMLIGNSEFRTFDLGFLAGSPGLLQFATHATVGLEVLYPILIWLPGWRPWVLAMATLMHLGIALGMGLTEFSLAMLAGNLALVPPRWFRDRKVRESNAEGRGSRGENRTRSAKLRPLRVPPRSNP